MTSPAWRQLGARRSAVVARFIEAAAGWAACAAPAHRAWVIGRLAQIAEAHDCGIIGFEHWLAEASRDDSTPAEGSSPQRPTSSHHEGTPTQRP